MTDQLITATLETREGTFTVETHNPATLNQIWGQVLSGMAQAGIVGEHSSSHGVFTPDPGDGGRTGVGNLSTDNDSFQFNFSDGTTSDGLSDGSQGGHALFQAMLFGAPFIPPDAAEASIDPIYPESSGSFTVYYPEDTIL
jgi:hypothetical protein